ncbi:hypothetical protein FS837_003373 [Tulasnella sp. UAMH 9824]|nr:hypothetical protein FS837_003373 [Tulasnella sp. UAMH 9824]
MRAIRPFGSSIGLINTSKEIQAGFQNVFQALEANLTQIEAEFSLETGSINLNINPADSSAKFTTGDLPLELACRMKSLSELLAHFRKGLREIPEFSDKPLADAMVEFQAWLDCRAERIESHEKCPLVQNTTTHRYIGQVMREMSFQTSKIKRALEDFVNKGVTAVKNAQEKSQAWLQNMSAVVRTTLKARQRWFGLSIIDLFKAAFLSGVTAATMQYDVQRNGLGTAVMGLWISSLILSIAAVVNSQLAIFWRAAIYRSPQSGPLTGIAILPEEAPLFCLTGAVLAFSVGLVIWTMASNLALPVKICAAVVTCATYVVIFIVVFRVSKDWWTHKEWILVHGAGARTTPYPMHRPWQDWRKDTMGETQGEDEKRVFGEPPSTTIAKLLHRCCRLIHLTTGFPFPPLTTDDKPRGKSTQRPADTSPNAPGPGIATHPVESPPCEVAMTPGQSNLQSKNRLPTSKGSLFYLIPQKVVLSPVIDSHFQLDDLKKLRPVHTLPIFHPAGYDMHFSPNGRYLGVGCINEAVAIWEVGSVYGKPEIVLASPTGRFGWSPDGAYVLVITKAGPSILEAGSWSVNCEPTEKGPISVVAWLQSSRALILANHAVLHVFDTELQSRTPYPYICLPIEAHDIASIPNASEGQYGFILVLGSLCDENTQKGPEAGGPDMGVDQPGVVCPEHWLMLIDLDAEGGGRSVAEAPTLAAARYICLWELRDDLGKTHLSFCRRFTPPEPEAPQGRNRYSRPATTGKARFCGIADEWVLATDGRSTIYIWDRYSGFLVHVLDGAQIRAQVTNDGGIIALTSGIRQNQRASPIVVSACRRGGVIVWEYPDEKAAQAESASEGETSKAGATHINPPHLLPSNVDVLSSSNCN